MKAIPAGLLVFSLYLPALAQNNPKLLPKDVKRVNASATRVKAIKVPNNGV